MKLRIDNIKIREDLTKEEIITKALETHKISKAFVESSKILKKSIDARDKNDIFYNYSILLDVKKDCRVTKNKNIILLTEKQEIETLKDYIKQNNAVSKTMIKPVIIGAGPAGLFCALTFIENGIKPIIIEQGKKVEERKKDVEEFIKTGKLNIKSNVQFGEGGAGTFSDGKLTTNLHTPICRVVINEFIRFGAPDSIYYTNKPHIGTDNLINIIANIRRYIIEKGGEFLFNSKVIDFNIENEKINKAIYEDEDKNKHELKTNTVILAVGHSSRDMFEVLYKHKANMERKNFSVGVRIEHKQEMLNKAQYGENTKLNLPPAEYKLAYHGKDRSCYTFCMCPGGEVIASSSEEGTIVINGMSKFARDGKNANSAVLVNVTPNDFSEDNPLAGMYFQKELEEKAFELGGSNYFAPIQTVKDFFKDKKTEKIGSVEPTYKPGVTFSNLNEIFPTFVKETLKEGIKYFDTKIKGFASDDAILTGVETRSSSPVTIKRDENMMSNIKGLYPCGEGAGYAGGIMSAAVDGIKVAMKISE